MGFSDDSFQVGMAVFCVAISLICTVMTPILVPEYDAEDADNLNEMRQKVEAFTGESMVAMSPWQLTSVRTPYTINSYDYVVSDYGWLYGSISTTYTLDGVNYIGESVVKFDPEQKSDVTLGQSKQNYSEYVPPDSDDWDDIPLIGPLRRWIINEIDDVDTWKERTGGVFNFSGLMYHFDSTYKFVTEGSSQTSLNRDMGSLNVVWYNNAYGSGISGGLVLQSDKSSAIIANYSSRDIIDRINTDSNLATKYLIDFDGINVYMYIYFDASAIALGENLQQAWDLGHWSIAFVSPSGDGLMDIFNSNNLSSSLGNVIDTYISIFTFDMPNAPAHWSVILWLICVLPMMLAMILFISRFLRSGLGSGIIASALGFLGL